MLLLSVMRSDIYERYYEPEVTVAAVGEVAFSVGRIATAWRSASAQPHLDDLPQAARKTEPLVRDVEVPVGSHCHPRGVASGSPSNRAAGSLCPKCPTHRDFHRPEPAT